MAKESNTSLNNQTKLELKYRKYEKIFIVIIENNEVILTSIHQR